MINRATGALERRCALDQFGPMVTLTARNCNGIGFAPTLLWRPCPAVTDAFDVDELEGCHVASELDFAVFEVARQSRLRPMHRADET